MPLATKPITPTQEARLDKAVSVTAKQIEIAKELVNQAFPGGDARQFSPDLLAAVVQALATNYLAQVTAASAVQP
jgi:hypothetical protein